MLGFSGGVDSCATAVILREQGFEVTAVTLDAVGDREMMGRAREAAGRIGLEWRAANVGERFGKEIINYFIEGYMRGETPAPCVLCNPAIKWRTLYDIAIAEGYDHIATGHYCRIRSDGAGYYVRKGADPVKDQSYYLWGVPQEYLRMALTPLGGILKSDVKAKYGGYASARESMSVCFLRGKDYATFLKERSGGCGRGEVVDRSDVVIGTHDGYPFYTIGQKRGLALAPEAAAALGGKAVVTAVDVANNRLVVGGDGDLYHKNLLVRDFNVVDMERLLSSSAVTVRVRGLGRNPAEFARVGKSGDMLAVELGDPAWACAKGQPVGFYEGDVVLGGGFLEKYW